MSDKYIVAQASVVGTLWSDGQVRLSESFSYWASADAEPTRYTDDHVVEGTCEPEELAYVTAQEYGWHV